MSEDTTTIGQPTSGQLIRAAREAAGLHIVALAAALKVPVRKLEALEGDRWDELTDATFARALASSVARHLRMDPAAVLAGLPTTRSDALDIPVGLGRAPQASASIGQQPMHSPVLWTVAAILLLAAVVYALPQGLLVWHGDAASTSSGAEVPVLAATTAEPLVQPPAAGSGNAVASQPSEGDPTHHASVAAAVKPGVEPPTAEKPLPVVASPTAPAVASGALVGTGARLHMVLKAPSWIEVTDANGKLRLQKVVPAGEVLDFDDATSYTVVVGNASGVDVTINGQPKDMTEFTRNNVARFQAR
ncbi:helix-turn-helix domain-containing protein [Hydrogenophaga soli]|nr:RodZ domain-containing protein [Burkholderiaceae bacterium]